MARGFNRVILVGNLTKDPELRYTSSKTPVASFTLAVNRMWKGKNGELQEDVAFVPIVVWGAQAENCERYLSKGRAALVEGRIATRSYEDKSGQKRYVTEVVADTVQFLGGGSRDGDQSESSGPRQSYGAPKRGDEPANLRSGFSSYGEDDSFPMDISEVGPSGGEAEIPF